MSHYTPSEIRTIRDNLDKSDREIAELIGRSRTSVTLFRKRRMIEKDSTNIMGRRGICLAQKIIIIESKLSSRKLAPLIGLHHSTVSNVRGR